MTFSYAHLKSYSMENLYYCSEIFGLNDTNERVKNVTEQNQFLNFNYILNGVVTFTTAAIGIVTNILSLVVFCGSRPSTLQLYLCALAVWDICLLVSFVMMCSFPILVYGRLIVNGTAYTYTYIYWYTLSNMSVTGTVWMVWMMTFDRYLALCHPFRHHYLKVLLPIRHKRMTVLVITTTSIAACLFGLPRFFELHIFQCMGDVSQQVSPYISITPLYINTAYTLVYKVICGLLCNTLVPYLALLLFLLKIYSALFKAAEWRKLSRPQSGAEMAILNNNNETGDRTRSGVKHLVAGVEQTNLALLLVIFKFLLSHLMMTALDVTELIIGMHNMNSDIVSYAVDISNYLVTVNSATNFWIYLMCCPTFGAVLCKRTLGKWTQRRQQMGAMERRRTRSTSADTVELVVRTRTPSRSQPPPIMSPPPLIMSPNILQQL